MSQYFTVIPLAHVCNCVCCFVYVKGHESDVCGEICIYRFMRAIWLKC